MSGYETGLLYKYLDEDGSAIMGRGKWSLPQGEQPGEWMPDIEGNLVPCQNGYHACREGDLPHWRGATLYVVEFEGETLEEETKLVGRRARLIERLPGWNPTNQRLYAADCAERVLYLFEEMAPQDDRPRKAIQAARAHARGEIGLGEMQSAAAAATDNAAAYAAYAYRRREREWQAERLLVHAWGRVS